MVASKNDTIFYSKLAQKYSSRMNKLVFIVEDNPVHKKLQSVYCHGEVRDFSSQHTINSSVSPGYKKVLL